MSVDTTENDAEIARLLAEDEDYDLASNCFNSNSPESIRSCSPITPKKFKTDDVQQKSDPTSPTQEKNPNSIQINEDAEMAFILQIEEIVLSENQINDKTAQVTDVQLEKTHADMTKALQPTQATDLMTRLLGMFVTIQTRYTDCQTKNQTLIDQMQKLAVHLYPMLTSFQAQGKFGVPKAAVPTLAVGLVTNVLQGQIEFNDAKQIMMNMSQIWNESNVWYEFLEQLVYILVAVTVPSFAQGAMGKIMGKISSSN